MRRAHRRVAGRTFAKDPRECSNRICGPITDNEAVQAFARLSREEGIIPAIESAHAVAYLEKLMPSTSKDDIVVVNLSGRGDKDTERLLQLLV